MGWVEDWLAQRDGDGGNMPESRSCYQCPDCGRALRPFNVRKEGPNRGRPFISCRRCDCFVWLDRERCQCGRNYIQFWTKGEPRRKMEVCPNKCEKARFV